MQLGPSSFLPYLLLERLLFAEGQELMDLFMQNIVKWTLLGLILDLGIMGVMVFSSGRGIKECH
jgi:hypothetical protein